MLKNLFIVKPPFKICELQQPDSSYPNLPQKLENRLFLRCRLSSYLVLPKPKVSKNLCFQDFEVRRISELENFCQNELKTQGISTIFPRLLTKLYQIIYNSETGSDSYWQANFWRKQKRTHTRSFFLSHRRFELRTP